MKTTSNIPNDAVAVGDLFFKVGGGEALWVVQRIFVTQADGIPHVALARLDDPEHRTVISMVTLLTENIFRPDRRKAEEENPPVQRRRKTDWLPRYLWKKKPN